VGLAEFNALADKLVSQGAPFVRQWSLGKPHIGLSVAANGADFDRDAIRNLYRDGMGVADLPGLPQPGLELDIVGFFESLGFHTAGRAERSDNLRAPECGPPLDRDDTPVVPNLAPQDKV